MYLFDTNIVKAVEAGDPNVVARLEFTSPDEVCISIVTAAEVLQGWLAQISKNQGNVRDGLIRAYDNFLKAQEDLRSIRIIRYSAQAEAIYQSFPSSVKRVGTNDCRIAATAIAHGLIVVTRNTRDFARIPNVKFEDWTT